MFRNNKYMHLIHTAACTVHYVIIDCLTTKMSVLVLYDNLIHDFVVFTTMFAQGPVAFSFQVIAEKT